MFSPTVSVNGYDEAIVQSRTPGRSPSVATAIARPIRSTSETCARRHFDGTGSARNAYERVYARGRRNKSTCAHRYRILSPSVDPADRASRFFPRRRTCCFSPRIIFWARRTDDNDNCAYRTAHLVHRAGEGGPGYRAANRRYVTSGRLPAGYCVSAAITCRP